MESRNVLILNEVLNASEDVKFNLSFNDAFGLCDYALDTREFSDTEWKKILQAVQDADMETDFGAINNLGLLAVYANAPKKAREMIDLAIAGNRFHFAFLIAMRGVEEFQGENQEIFLRVIRSLAGRGHFISRAYLVSRGVSSWGVVGSVIYFFHALYILPQLIIVELFWPDSPKIDGKSLNNVADNVEDNSSPN